ncbi:MAG: PASTA domain-containing protein [Clostridia bacterium]|nr:PASTA domain-containing protein [Clostridia bacterium]
MNSPEKDTKGTASNANFLRRFFNRKGTFEKRAQIMLIVFAAPLLFLIGMFFKIQIIDYDFYQKQVIEELTLGTSLSAKRGDILDANGNLLATNKTVWLIFISPDDIQEAKEEKGIPYDEMIAEKLSEVLEVDYETVYKKANKANRQYEEIKEGVEEKEKDEILAFIDEHDLDYMIYARAQTTRYYPYSTLASHVIGFTGADNQGLYGLEQYYDSTLKGKDGKYITATDAHGNEIPYDYSSYVNAENGLNIVTTIDTYIQRELELQLATTLEESGAQSRVSGIVMDVNTGAILGMAVLPSYDLNDPNTLDALSLLQLDKMNLEVGSSEYNEAKLNLLFEMWNNETISMPYEPGSTFKPITAAVGVDLDLVSGKSGGYSCPGYHMVGGWPISCHKKTGHGSSFLFEYGLQQSCNPTMMQLADKIGTSKFYSYISAFGYLEKTGIDLPSEAKGAFWSEKAFAPTDLAVSSFGQRFKVTMIEHITAMAAIANGGTLVTPYLVSEITDSDNHTVWSRDTTVKRRVISESTATEITRILEEGVSGDGGAKNAYVKGYKIAAKTGTSQKFDDGGSGQDTGKRIGSCIGYAPADNPSIISIIVVDEPSGTNVYGGNVAAPYIANLMANVLPYLGYQPTYAPEDQVPKNVGNYVGTSIAKATAAIEKLGLQWKVIGEGTQITSQFPERGTQLLENLGTVYLYTEGASEETVIVPRVVGLTPQNANQALINHGLNIKIEGAENYETGDSVLTVEQSIPEGTPVPRGTVVTVTFRHTDITD